MNKFKSTSQITPRNREILIEKRVKELFKVREPGRCEDPKRTALKLAATRSASHLQLHIKIAQSKKRLIDKFKKQPCGLDQALSALERKKSNPEQQPRSNKSSKQRVRERFKDFNFNPENNKDLQR